MKYPSIIQHSEEDCGAASLATIVKYYGRNFSINRIREAVGTGQQGTNLLGLKRGAETLGFNTRIGRVNAELVDRINEAPLPAIIHWKGYHWVVLYGQKGRKYIIADPSVGIRYINRKELDEAWQNGVILILNPDETRFSQQSDDPVKGFGHFLKLAFNYRSVLGQAITLNLLVGLLSLATPFLLQILTDDLLLQQDWQLLSRIAIVVMMMNLFSSILEWAQSNLIAHFGERLELGLILQFTRQILRLPLNYYETRRSGEVLIRLQDIQEINQLIFQAVISLPSQLFVALVSLGFMVLYSSQLTLIALSISLLMVFPALLSFTSLRHKMRQILVAEGENLGILIELFKGAISLKTSNIAPQAWSELQGRFGSLARITFRTLQIVLFNQVFSKLVSGIGTIAILWFGSNLVFHQQLTIGQLLAFNTMNGNYLAFIVALVGFFDKFTLTQAAGERLSETLEATPENINDSKKPWTKISSTADIICNKLDFHYPGRIELIEDFSLTIPGGKVTALIGKSGCGKSTVAKLIASAYLPKSGTIVFGNYNQRDLPLDCLRQQIVLVPQESHFWTRSILDNFRWSYPFSTFEQIVAACEIAGIADFINSLPDGYQTVLGEFGTNLSGGQKQRLAIARALINDPPILILDESTGALDPISEARVLQQLLTHRSGKTTIIISHRPKVITRAEWIILLDEGKLKLEGNLTKLQSFSGEHLDFISN